MTTTSPSGRNDAPTQNSTVWNSRELSFFNGAAPVPLRPALGRAVPAPRREPLAGGWVEVDMAVISLHLSQVGEAGLEAVGTGAAGAEDECAEPADVAAGEQR